MNNREEFEKWCVSLGVNPSERMAEVAYFAWQARQPEIDALKQRAEAAEARIKAAEEQDPYWICGNTLFHIPLGKKLYAAPIPPADVQELQKRVREMADGLAMITDIHNQQKAELERKLADAIASKNTALDNLTVAHAQIDAFIGKLAEQQAVIHSLSPATKESGNGCNELTTLLAAEYQRGREDERAEAEKEEPVGYVSPEVIPHLKAGGRWGGARITRKDNEDGCTDPLYTRPLAQKPLSEELLRFLHGMDNIDGVWFGDIHPAEQGVFWWRKYLPTVANGITEKKEG